MQAIDFDPKSSSDIVIGGLGKNGGAPEFLLVTKLSSASFLQLWTNKYHTPASSGNTPKTI
jgi:hypothetical protein